MASVDSTLRDGRGRWRGGRTRVQRARCSPARLEAETHLFVRWPVTDARRCHRRPEGVNTLTFISLYLATVYVLKM